MGILFLASVGIPTAWAVADDAARGWVLQLGYFGNLDNALALQRAVREAGFSARVLSTGRPGGERYRVVTGHAAAAADLADLRDRLENRIGQRGFAVENPVAGRAMEVVDGTPVAAGPAPTRRLAARAPPGTDRETAGPMRAADYQPGFDRSLQGTPPWPPGVALGGGVELLPTLDLALGYDDNVTRAPHDEIASWFYMIAPAVRLNVPLDHSHLTATAGIDVVRYQDSTRDDREPWWARAEWSWDATVRQDLRFFSEYSEGVDRRGQGRLQGEASLIDTDPDAWKRFGFGGDWDYGAAGAAGRLQFRAGAYDLTYTNNREPLMPGGTGTAVLDRAWRYLGGTFSWRVAPKTSLLADYQYTDMDYDSATSDSVIQRGTVGVTWEATARTSGTIAVGREWRDFDDPARDDFAGLTWTASVDWSPRTYSTFRLATSRRSQEPDGGGDYRLRRDVTLSWLHDWTEDGRFGTSVDLGYGKDAYRPAGRTDDLIYWGLGARYTYNPHLRFGLSVSGSERDSDAVGFEYDRRVYMLTVEASL